MSSAVGPIAGAVTRVPVTPADAQRFEVMGKSVWQDMVGKLYPQALLDKAVAAASAAAGGNSAGVTARP